MRPTGDPRPHPALHILLEEQGRSFKWLSRRTGYHPETLSRTFRGINPPSSRLRRAVSMALEVDEHELFDDTAVAS